jgi:predicted acyltransferase (DUF342 family)
MSLKTYLLLTLSLCSVPASLACGSLFNDLASRPCGNVQLPADLGGLTITPGVYCITAAATFTSNVILDAQNQPNAVFVIKTAGAFNSAAGMSLTVINGRAQVLLVAVGAFTLGGNSLVQASLSTAAAVTLGAGAVVTGSVSAKAAITVGALGRIDGSLCSDAAITLGAGALVQGSASSVGAISVGAGAAINGPTASETGQIAVVGGGSVVAASPPRISTSLNCSNLYQNIQSRPCGLRQLPADFGGLTITPGVYCINSAATFTTNVLLDAQNSNSAVFIFKINGACNSVASQSLKVINGAAQVVIACNGAATLGASSLVQATIATTAGTTLGASVRVEGSLCAGGAITIGGLSVVTGKAISAINMVSIGAGATVGSN